MYCSRLQAFFLASSQKYSVANLISTQNKQLLDEVFQGPSASADNPYRDLELSVTSHGNDRALRVAYSDYAIEEGQQRLRKTKKQA